MLLIMSRVALVYLWNLDPSAKQEVLSRCSERAEFQPRVIFNFLQH